ncbi:hypothetical protein HOLleu_27610 [Holothuria leucospilota]|uniref:Uncharacterized protein n=1 Tax=Holothuria leucospilota TaxID=206669 RepID=A0A9Q1H2W0_HOLLE|nr:hypothetical protein HOLleu_27610 [Holothuria leucospilota]
MGWYNFWVAFQTSDQMARSLLFDTPCAPSLLVTLSSDIHCFISKNYVVYDINNT